MARSPAQLSKPAKEELQAVLLERVAHLRECCRLGRALGDDAIRQRLELDVWALRRAGAILGCPVPQTTGRPRPLHECVRAALTKAGRPIDTKELVRAVERELPGTVERVNPRSVWAVVCRMVQRGELRKEGPQSGRRYALAPAAGSRTRARPSPR